MHRALRTVYKTFRPILRPIVRSAAFKKAGILSFDAFLMRAKSEARISTFKPRYPFALERGECAKLLQAPDVNNPFGHEPELAHLLDLLVPDDGVFLDIGSNSGYFSILLGTRMNFRGHIHAFEPIASTFSVLKGMVDNLGCADVVTCHQAAVSSKNGTVNMDMGTDPGLAMINTKSTQGQTVKAITLDSLKLPRADFLKIDVEGHEIETLRGAKTTIKATNPYIFLESWSFDGDPDKVFEPLQFLIDRGYKLYLPAWLQPNGTFFVGIGPDWERKKLALVPFNMEDRMTFPGNPINIFACPASRTESLGK